MVTSILGLDYHARQKVGFVAEEYDPNNHPPTACITKGALIGPLAPIRSQLAKSTKKMQGGSSAGQQGQKPTFTKGKDLCIQEVSGSDQGRSAVAAASSAAPSSNTESSIAAAVGKIDELLASLRRLEGRVDGITTEIAGLKGAGIGEVVMLTDGEDDRDSELQGRRKTLRIR